MKSSLANQTRAGRPASPMVALVIGALGVVFGDIGTSPLYAFEVVFANDLHPVTPTPENILGILSLFIWALLLVFTGKYVVFMMRFDNAGQGGIVALTTLLLNNCAQGSRLRRWFVPLGLLGAALFYGDGVVTPAISVVSAVEGLETISPALGEHVVPIAVIILVVLFSLQKRGTATISKVFGPLMLVWFTVIAALGIHSIVGNPVVLEAISPLHAVRFVMADPVLSFFLLGAVVLCITGAEALYADMGHFGVSPIRRAWILIAFPALILNYLGQGALVLLHPDNLHNPFFRLAPDWGLNALVVLATMATVVASQAVISGVFSMTQQLIQLGAVPRMKVVHTSQEHSGQIYLPAINWIMLTLVVIMVLIFQTANAMGGAYGIAVTGTMLITDTFALAVVLHVKRWPLAKALCIVAPLMVIDLLFFSANAMKIVNGGWYPSLVSAIVLLLMLTWVRGSKAMRKHEEEREENLVSFVERLNPPVVRRNESMLVCFGRDEHITPASLMLIMDRLNVIPQKVICLSVKIHEVPFISPAQRQVFNEIGKGVYSLVLHYGYMERVQVPLELKTLFPNEDPYNDYGYLLSGWSLDVREGDGWALWRKRLFGLLLRNVTARWRTFELPPDRVVELGQRLIL